jgi:enterochelin esterase family protein
MGWPRWFKKKKTTALSLFMTVAMMSGAHAGETLLHQQIQSAALGGHKLTYALYKPADQPPQGKRWPVLYLLHGLGDTDRAWVEYGHIENTMDRLIGEGRIPPMLVVMPGAGRSWYVNNPDPGGDGLMQRAITHDLVEHVDAAYPTLRCRTGRLIGGLSMGGYGALLYAMDHPRLYAAAFSFSGGLWRMTPANPDASAMADLSRFNVVFGHPLNPLRKNLWSLFSRIPAYVADPERTPIWMSIGDHDYPRLRVSNLAFAKALAREGVSVPFRTDPGGHEWGLWSKDLTPALIWAAKSLRESC